MKPLKIDNNMDKKEILKELNRLLRLFGNRPRGCVHSERIEGYDSALYLVRKEIRERIKTLEQKP